MVARTVIAGGLRGDWKLAGRQQDLVSASTRCDNEVIVENDVDMEINHVFDSFQDEDDRRKARFAA